MHQTAMPIAAPSMIRRNESERTRAEILYGNFLTAGVVRGRSSRHNPVHRLFPSPKDFRDTLRDQTDKQHDCSTLSRLQTKALPKVTRRGSRIPRIQLL